MMTHFVGSPFWKLASVVCPVNVLNRSAEFVELNPDWPPSPYMICGQTTDEPVVSNVPLSCVPPWRCFGLSAATDRLWNCSVERPLFRSYSCVGTAESSCLQRAMLVGPSGRVSHCPEMSAKLPLVRTRPPSEPKIAESVPGIATMACSSGCIPFGANAFGLQHWPARFGVVVASHVMSVKFAPASVERRNARPLVAKPYVS